MRRGHLVFDCPSCCVPPLTHIQASTQRITALLNYDFACILHPCYEFLHSFDGAGDQFRGWFADDAGEQAALRNAKLHGFPSPVPQSSSNGV
ncbi:hypothetical protein F5Y15DRAFT_390848 [Xylariaceae sp. FL0016]|nr:hypothetical protein F5Y15DRAFT_390848 [Xylariaceae sp. FL0016]